MVCISCEQAPAPQLAPTRHPSRAYAAVERLRGARRWRATIVADTRETPGQISSRVRTRHGSGGRRVARSASLAMRRCRSWRLVLAARCVLVVYALLFAVGRDHRRRIRRRRRFKPKDKKRYLPIHTQRAARVRAVARRQITTLEFLFAREFVSSWARKWWTARSTLPRRRSEGEKQ